jgi:hypothetical protein
MLSDAKFVRRCPELFVTGGGGGRGGWYENPLENRRTSLRKKWPDKARNALHNV